MSEESVGLVRQLLAPIENTNVVTDVWFRGDDPAWEAAKEQYSPSFTDDYVCVLHPGASEPLTRSGQDGARALWLDWFAPWESYRFELQRVIDLGDRVLTFTRDFGRRRGMEDEVELPSASAVYTIRDGKIARAEYFTDRAEAIEAAGLSE